LQTKIPDFCDAEAILLFGHTPDCIYGEYFPFAIVIPDLYKQRMCLIGRIEEDFTFERGEGCSGNDF